MFKLLDLAPLTFNMSAAKKNYKRIMSIVHPDKNSSEYAASVSKAVTHAYTILSDSTKRLYYMKHGKPSAYEPYDDSETIEAIVQLNNLLELHEKKEHGAPSISSQPEEFASESKSSEINTSEDKEPKSTKDTVSSDSPFESFLKQCKDAAASSSDSSSPDEGRHSSASLFSAQKSPVIKPSDSVSPPKVSPTQEEKVSRPNSAGSNPESDEQSKKSTSSGKSKEPEVVVVDSEDDYDSDAPIDWDKMFRRARSVSSSPESKSSCSDKKEDSAYKSQARPSSEQPPRAASSGSGCNVNSSSSPVRKTYVDVATSPFKPGDDVTFVDLSTLSSSSSQSRPSRARRNLDFSSRSYTDSTPRTPLRDNSYTGNPVPERSHRRKYIMAILRLRSRATGVFFKVRWGPSGDERIESAATVMQEKIGLRNWLSHLRLEEPRRFNAILRYHPEFQVVLEKKFEGVPLTTRKNVSFG